MNSETVKQPNDAVCLYHRITDPVPPIKVKSLMYSAKSDKFYSMLNSVPGGECIETDDIPPDFVGLVKLPKDWKIKIAVVCKYFEDYFALSSDEQAKVHVKRMRDGVTPGKLYPEHQQILDEIQVKE